MMKRRITLTLLTLALGLASGASAQERIDRLMDRVSSARRVTFTSTLVRDPDTRRVRSIVRELSAPPNSGLNDDMREAFRQEARRARKADAVVRNGVFQQWLTFESATRQSVYRLTIDRDGYYLEGALSDILSGVLIGLLAAGTAFCLICGLLQKFFVHPEVFGPFLLKLPVGIGVHPQHAVPGQIQDLIPQDTVLALPSFVKQHSSRFVRTYQYNHFSFVLDHLLELQYNIH